MTRLVDIGISTRTITDNPWFDRLQASLEARSTGIPAELLIESGEELTKVEKRLRLFRRSQARYLCILEDDAEVLHDGWLYNLVSRMAIYPNLAILNPTETRCPADDAPNSLLADVTHECTWCAGFCMVIDRESGIEPDVRVQTLDDLWLSLAARAKGWRCAKTEAAMVRHTKEPFERDDVTPSAWTDRTRWGEGADYYDVDRHTAKRRHEAQLMIETFGDLARLTLPKELLNREVDPLWTPPASDCEPPADTPWYRSESITPETVIVSGY